jgi:protein-disulfide isomerase
MRGASLVAAAVALVAVSSVAAAKPSTTHTRSVRKPGAKVDWARTVSVTPEGGFRMGNPNARVAVVEYGSLACPHCRHFEETGFKPLVDSYVRTGQVSYEFRNILINGPDISVSLLTRCAGPANFFPMSEAVYASQPQWEEKVQAISGAQKDELDKMTDQQRIVRYAEIAQMPQLAARFGVKQERARQCLADPKALQRLLDIVQAASKIGVDHTPTFLVNGKVTDAATWEQLEPLIRQAGAHG